MQFRDSFLIRTDKVEKFKYNSQKKIFLACPANSPTRQQHEAQVALKYMIKKFQILLIQFAAVKPPLRLFVCAVDKQWLSKLNWQHMYIVFFFLCLDL